MPFITYREAAAQKGISVIAVCRYVQDLHIPLRVQFGNLYLEWDALKDVQTEPLRTTVKRNIKRYEKYYDWCFDHPEASDDEARAKFRQLYGVRDEQLAG